MLTAEQIKDNWSILIGIIEDHISEPRKEKVLQFYEKYQERLILMPAAHKKEYHNAFPGGYIDHVIRVVNCAIDQYKIWKKYGVDVSSFTPEELVFSALHHDLGKMGDEYNEAYIPQDDEWRKNKLGEDYKFNDVLAFASVPDRGLYLLQANDIKYTFNEMVAIQTHDGLYDEANKKYLHTFMPEQKPRNALPYILHFADLMAARIEFEKEWLPKFGKKNKPIPKTEKPVSSDVKVPNKTKALASMKSEGLMNLLSNLD